MQRHGAGRCSCAPANLEIWLVARALDVAAALQVSAVLGVGGLRLRPDALYAPDVGKQSTKQYVEQ